MKKETLRKHIMALNGLIGFGYNGKYGNVESHYKPETKTTYYLLYYDGNEIYLDTSEEICQAPFFEGKSIMDIAEDLEYVELG